MSSESRTMSRFAFCVVSGATADRFRCATVGWVTIDMLPDNVLLEIFHFYKDDFTNFLGFTWRWKTLTQVCRRWRHIVFESPRRLDLQLVCTRTTPTSRLLDVWLHLPIAVLVSSSPHPPVDKNSMENLIAALECRDRISKIHISDIQSPVLETLATVLHEPLPILTTFSLRSTDDSVPVLPETFFGGFAPSLRTFWSTGIPFSTFPKFLLCFTNIVYLCFRAIPSSGYILPEVMATSLAALPHLGFFSIEFRSPPLHLPQSSPPHLTRASLPSLSHLTFSGVSEYFEDFVARIDTPRLTRLSITFFMDLNFDIPRLRNFIDHNESLKPFNQAAMKFSSWTIAIVFGSSPRFELKIRCGRPDRQLSSMMQIFSQQSPLLSFVEQLEVSEDLCEGSMRKDDPEMDPLQWRELFRLFAAAQSLHVSERLVSPVARALQDIAGQMATEVLPVLRTISLEGLQPSGPVHEAINSFATVRQLSHQPVVIQPWDQQE